LGGSVSARDPFFVFFIPEVNRRFCWGFWENVVQLVVFWWSFCGVLHGKDGFLSVGFRRGKIRQLF
jgi:hypothetical protein